MPLTPPINPFPLTSMSSTVQATSSASSTSNVQLITDALVDYARITGIELSKNPFAAAIERYRALGLWGSDPVIRREGYDRLHAAMRAAGALKRDIPYETCVDTSLAERAVAEG